MGPRPMRRELLIAEQEAEVANLGITWKPEKGLAAGRLG